MTNSQTEEHFHACGWSDISIAWNETASMRLMKTISRLTIKDKISNILQDMQYSVISDAVHDWYLSGVEACYIHYLRDKIPDSIEFYTDFMPIYPTLSPITCDYCRENFKVGLYIEGGPAFMKGVCSELHAHAIRERIVRENPDYQSMSLCRKKLVDWNQLESAIRNDILVLDATFKIIPSDS